MDSIRRYIFTLICMAILCGLVSALFENSSTQKKLIKFAAGILMVIVALTPLLGSERLKFNRIPTDLGMEAQSALYAGKEQADGMLRQIITEQTQAYILDKATSMGVELSAEVILSDTDPPTPETIVLTGTVSPYVKKQLSNTLISELEISEDKLQWNY